MPPTVAVVIPNFNGADILGACLDAVAAQTHPPDELVVLDNGSSDGSADIARQRGVRVVALDRNHGFAGGANRGVAATTTDWVAVLNSDARPEPTWLAELLAHTGREDAWVLGSVLVSSTTGTVESAADQWSDEGYAYKVGRGLAVSELPAEPYSAFAAPGASPLFRRTMFDQLGGYEERYFLYYEDVDLAYRALLRGWCAYVVPSARVEHDLGASSTRARVRFHVARNSLWTAVRCIPDFPPKAVGWRILHELRWNRPRNLVGHEIKGRLAALAGMRWALRSRREVQATRVTSIADIAERLRPPAPFRD